MNPETYEQTEIAKVAVGPQAGFLDPGMKVSVEFVEGRPVGVLFPDALEMRIAARAVVTRITPARSPIASDALVTRFITTCQICAGVCAPRPAEAYRKRTEAFAKQQGPPTVCGPSATPGRTGGHEVRYGRSCSRPTAGIVDRLSLEA